jgi:hypothetical protein
MLPCPSKVRYRPIIDSDHCQRSPLHVSKSGAPICWRRERASAEGSGQAMRSNRRDKNNEPEKRPLSLWECVEILQDIGMSDDVIVDCVCRCNVCLTRPGNRQTKQVVPIYRHH